MYHPQSETFKITYLTNLTITVIPNNVTNNSSNNLMDNNFSKYLYVIDFHKEKDLAQ